jgi:hypothetical protein
MLIPYEQIFIQPLHENGNLVLEQHSNKTNPLFQLVIDRLPPTPQNPLHTSHDLPTPL